jgi:nucleoside phosphorylase
LALDKRKELLSLENATIGILTVLPHEFQAACRILGCEDEVASNRDGSGRLYKLGVVKHRSSSGSHVVAVAQLLGMGIGPAATRATLLFQDCRNVQNIILCGIAGAVPDRRSPERHVRLGDIVVGVEGIRQYDLIKQGETYEEDRSKHLPASADLIEVARLLQAESLGGTRPWDRYIAHATETLGSRWTRPGSAKDILRDPVGLRALWRLKRTIAKHLGKDPVKTFPYPIVTHPVQPDRIDGIPSIFHGLIASANIPRCLSGNGD